MENETPFDDWHNLPPTDVPVSGAPNASDHNHLTFREKIRNIWQSGKDDFHRTDNTGKVIIGGFVANIGYELFVGNEVMTPLLGGQSLEVSRGIGSVAASAVITGVPVYIQQRLGGTLSRRTAQQFPSVSREAYRGLNEDSSSNTYSSFRELPVTKKLFYSFVLGSTFNVTREAMVTGDVQDSTLRPIEKTSSAITAGTVSALAAGVNVANQTLQNNEVAQVAIDYGIKNPLLWLGLGGLLIAMDKLKSRRDS